MEGINKRCFVCNTELSKVKWEVNYEVNLSVCESCKGSENENAKVKVKPSNFAGFGIGSFLARIGLNLVLFSTNFNEVKMKWEKIR